MTSSTRMQINTLLLVLVMGCLLNVCYGIKVRNLTVPQSYVLDRNTVAGQKPITLDCEYETDGNDTGVVLKWFFNNNPIYQWIPGSNPIPLQRFKPHLSTTFAVNHPKQMYRALHISNPTWNMTGKYTCSLQSFQSSDRETAQMIVIEPEKEFDLDVESSEDENVIITCNVSGIYPKPILSINVNGSHIPGIVTDNESTRPTDGLYEVHVKVNMSKSQIDVPAKIQCVLEIPETDYVKDACETYNEVKTTTTTTTGPTFTYKDGESDEMNQISRLEAIVGSRENGNGVEAHAVASTLLLVLSTMFLRYVV